LKQEIKERQNNNVWNTVFQDGNVEAWKRKYLFPFGEITPIVGSKSTSPRKINDLETLSSLLKQN